MLVFYATAAEYRDYYERSYCQATLYTFDGLRVHFARHQFGDAFFESADRRERDKSVFSRPRAERIDWIRAAIEDPTAELYQGWDRDKKRVDRGRRVTIVFGDYVVVLQLSARLDSAFFITAYVAGASTLEKIRKSPRW